MNPTRMFVLSLIAALCAVTAVAQSSSDDALRDRITNAVMKVYDDQLAKDPNDYNTLFARAHQHYYNGDYNAALADVNQAILITPKTDHELRFDEYILRARISDARKDYTSELADLRLAQELEPKSLACTDLIAKANLKARNYDAAEKAFKTILRAESMNYDAMYGMALVEQGRGNAKAALERVDKAVELFRAEPQVYINRADIYTRQGNIDAAVDDLLHGMSVGDGGNAVQGLFDLSDTNYDAVMNALSTLADKSSDGGGMERYLRSHVAMDHSRYGQALRDLNYIKRNGLYDSPSVYYGIAKCCLELGRYEEALTNADRALGKDLTQPEYYLIKSQAQYQLDGGDITAAMETLNSCSALMPQNVPMLMAKASLLASQGLNDEALGYLNAAVANDPGNGEALFARGSLLKKMDNLKLAVKDFSLMTKLGDDMYDLKGFALSELGRDNDALGWLQRLTSRNEPGGENFYYAAALMALRGDNYMAMEYLQRAVDNGYGSLYRLQNDKLSPVNIEALRNVPEFDLLIEKAQRNFVERL